VLVSLVPEIGTALEFECSVPDDTRALRVDLPGSDHLCEVSVTGEDGERRVMWYADNGTQFCLDKARELRDRYTEEWGFDCRARPDRDGVDRLSPSQRALFDRQLKRFWEQASTDASSPAVRGVRAVTSAPLGQDSGMLALQFFLADGTDPTLVAVDENGRWTTLAGTGDLAAEVTPVSRLRTRAAFVTAIGESGTLELVTRLVPEPGEDDDIALCGGRQTLRADPDRGFVPATPHRHVCGGAIEPVPAVAD